MICNLRSGGRSLLGTATFFEGGAA